MPIVVNFTETEKAYWAGICDGEMYIRWSGAPQVKLESTDIYLVDNLATIYNIKSYLYSAKKPRCKDTKAVYLCSDNCRDFLRKVSPYLLVKDRQADIILNREENPNEKLMILNKTGINHELREPKDVLWTPERFSYYAGLVDGEGCISYRFNRYQNPYFRLGIGMCDPGAILPISLKYNVRLGKIDRSKRGWRDYYTVELSLSNMKPFLNGVYPYLRLKKLQADLVLNCGSTVDEKLFVVKELQKLNKRGKKTVICQ